MQTVYTLPGGPYTRILLEQSTNPREVKAETSFRLTYGQQVTRGLSYTAAAQELGAAIMHRAACDGLILDSEEV